MGMTINDSKQPERIYNVKGGESVMFSLIKLNLNYQNIEGGTDPQGVNIELVI